MEKQHDKLLEQAEEMGRVFEKMGFTPMQGRILSYLAGADGGERSFEEIMMFFKTSKSTVSNSLNYLLSTGLIDYKSRVGERKRYFYLTKQFPVAYVRLQLDLINAFKEQAYKSLSTQSVKNIPGTQQLIHQWIDFANRFEKSLVALHDYYLEN